MKHLLEPLGTVTFVKNYYFHRLKNTRRHLEIVRSKLQAASMGRDLSL